MLKGWGRRTSLQNLFKICRWQFPFWAPQFPVLAICTSSGWLAPSCNASSAKVCTKVADKMPVAHNWSSFEARPDWPPGAFSKAALLTGTLPDSISSSHPLSLLAMPTLCIGLFQAQTFSKTQAFPQFYPWAQNCKDTYETCQSQQPASLPLPLLLHHCCCPNPAYLFTQLVVKTCTIPC